MARVWLKFPDNITAKDVRPVNFDDPGRNPPPQTAWQEPSDLTYKIPILPEFERPYATDVRHRGPRARGFEVDLAQRSDGSVGRRRHHAVGQLLPPQRGLHEADHLYELLRKEFPKSQHVENAYVLGAYVKLMEYQGPEYDPTPISRGQEAAGSDPPTVSQESGAGAVGGRTQEDGAGGSRPNLGRRSILESQGQAEGHCHLLQRVDQEISHTAILR